ncbi:flagellar hook-length control protein FliK [Ectobacillus polymachus]|uniref:flagellar hook-length control protein FliK n=1 Tax=Ectobacillus polymachus TaxID=1508806 RepID=UPI003A890A8C
MQLSILPVKEYNVSNDAKEKEASSSSFLDYLQKNQADSEKKDDASTNVTFLAAYPTAMPMNMEQPSTDAIMNGSEYESDLLSPVKESSDLLLQGQALKPRTDVAEMAQQTGSMGMQQVSQAVDTNQMFSQSMGINVQKSGTMNRVMNNQGIISKVESEPDNGKIETLLKNLQQTENMGMQQVNQAVAINQKLLQVMGINVQKSGIINMVMDNQGILSKVESESNTGKTESHLNNLLLQQAGNVSQAVATNQKFSHSMGMNVQVSGTMNMTLNNQSLTEKVQNEPTTGKIETLLNNQMVQQAGNVSQAVTTNQKLSQATGMNIQESGMMNRVINNQGMMDKVESELNIGNTESLHNSNNPIENLMKSPATKTDTANLLKELQQSAKNESKRTENKSMTNDSNPIQDKNGPSNNSVLGSIPTVNLQATKSVEVHTAFSTQATVDKLAQDITSTFLPRIQVTGTPEKMEATLSLTPEHLGTVDVKVVIQDGQVSARLIADSSLGRATLEQHVDSLYAALQQQGLQVDTIHISQHQSSFSSAFSQGGDSAPKQGQQQPKRRGDSYNDKEDYSDAALYESEWVSQINTIA